MPYFCVSPRRHGTFRSLRVESPRPGDGDDADPSQPAAGIVEARRVGATVRRVMRVVVDTQRNSTDKVADNTRVTASGAGSLA